MNGALVVESVSSYVFMFRPISIVNPTASQSKTMDVSQELNTEPLPSADISLLAVHGIATKHLCGPKSVFPIDRYHKRDVCKTTDKTPNKVN